MCVKEIVPASNKRAQDVRNKIKTAETQTGRKLFNSLLVREPDTGLAPPNIMIEITNAFDAYSVLKEHMTSDVEEVWALALNSNLRLIETKMIFRGTVDSCLIHPRDLFRFACLANASQIVVAHNHPSGDLNPSKEDIKITKQLISASRLIEIPILDHLILTKTHYCSMAQQGFFTNPRHPIRKGLREF